MAVSWSIVRLDGYFFVSHCFPLSTSSFLSYTTQAPPVPSYFHHQLEHLALLPVSSLCCSWSSSSYTLNLPHQSVFAMAPTHPTLSAHVTRSVARKNGGTLRSLGAGVQKRFQCIICDKKHGSKAALSRHFKSHTTRPEVLSPFCHPSCWNEDSSHYPPSKRSFHDIMVEDDLFDALPSKRQRAIKNKFEYARAGVKNNRQLRQQKDLQHWSMLHWWFRTNEESLRARMEFGPEGLFPLQGKLIALDRQGLAANLTAWLRRTQARR